MKSFKVKLLLGFLIVIGTGLVASRSHGDFGDPHDGIDSSQMEPDGHGGKLEPDGHGSKSPMLLRATYIGGVPAYLPVDKRTARQIEANYLGLDKDSVYVIDENGQPVLLGNKSDLKLKSTHIQESLNRDHRTLGEAKGG